MVTIRNEMRMGVDGEPEVWTNLGDVLEWLDTLPENTHNRVAAATALEIRQMLLDQVTNAPLVRKEGSY
jgi:hypothetical protein